MVWEFEFFKAFHLLRDGTMLPTKFDPATGLVPTEMRRLIDLLRRMRAADFYLTSAKLGNELGGKRNLKRPPTSVDLWWAEQERRDELFALERNLEPPETVAQERRPKIWSDLIEAHTYAAVRKACGRWAQLPDVRRAGMTPFPRHVLQHATQFLSMKRNKRFPRSAYGDASRLDYLARGMAGIMVGVSPMTGIERLRNMKHTRNGPFWLSREGNQELPESQQRCTCWRCALEWSLRMGQVMLTAYENGQRLFMELAAKTHAPKEWNKRALMMSI
jgi:hypothetical protein